METIRNEHLSEAELENCARGRLLRQDAPAVLSHLTNCDHCAELLEAELDLRRGFRLALGTAAARPSVLQMRPTWARVAVFPAPVAIAALAVAAILLFSPSFRASTAAPQAVELRAFRGVGEVTASAGRPLQISLDGAGLDAAADVELRIVDEAGRQVWQSKPRPSGGNSTDVVHAPLGTGVFWVRLNAPGQVEPLREYRLQVE